MLKEHSRFFATLVLILDGTILVAAWLLAYYLRFHLAIIPVTKGVPGLDKYLVVLPGLLVIWGLVLRSHGLYQSKRTASLLDEAWDLARASSVALVIFIALSFFFRHYELSRVVLAYFWALSTGGLISSRLIFRTGLGYLRGRGFNLRHVLILGTEALGQRVLEKFRAHPQLGLNVMGFLSGSRGEVGRAVAGVPVLGVYADLPGVLRARAVDQVILALPLHALGSLGEILKSIEDEMVEIRVVPDLLQFVTLRGGVEEFDGLPFVGLQQSPLHGWNRVLKRATDITLSALALLVMAPLIAAIALAIKLTSRGPVFFRQERMGLDGKVFQMLKFRTMPVDAEAETGPVWAVPHDPRRTALGRWLRRLSLDELPQLWNVLRGDMSLVGPRPERPVFIEQFRGSVPRYMLRHTMKAGITGWAQVNGWRGQTSLEKRIEYDLYYIEHWSLGFDLKILALTLVRGLFSRNAY
ncbi:MAG: undecaprenyl-phosphate glucose phosphotransferase [Deltaproteobacteria bacterium]|nr:undecaprenyl-phosphate glucose phosphotransferase [Deltaproteobacteria bacterium]